MKKKKTKQESKEKKITKTKTPSKKERPIKTVKEKMQVIGRSSFNFYTNKDGEVIEILKVNGVSGARQLHPTDLQILIEQFASGLRSLKKSLNFIILDFLVDYQKQINYYQHKISQTTNPHKKHWLQVEVDKLTNLQKYSTEEHYFVVLFGESNQEVIEQKSQLMRIKALNCEEISVTEKDALLYKLHNLNSIVANRLRGDDGE